MDQFFDIEFWSSLIENYKEIGPVIAILLPIIESMFPFFPLVAFTTLNIVAFGNLWGYLYSLIGESIGSLIVFWFFRRFIKDWFNLKTKNSEKINKIKDWVNNKGYGILVLLLSLPFIPAALVDIGAGLSDISFKAFFLAVLIGKSIMIFILVYVGHSAVEILSAPEKLFISIPLLLIAWFLSKFIQKKIDI
ncbi:MAG TPA: TVP38/TMEM64 family protein [Tenericutes bacterium]|jgi:uncharacterized membrane protein YdjX (TVP38/TMEM64 family)|nr:TVP38/TMEM64 family protein [Mycoplasmatota bacterium]